MLSGTQCASRKDYLADTLEQHETAKANRSDMLAMRTYLESVCCVEAAPAFVRLAHAACAVHRLSRRNRLAYSECLKCMLGVARGDDTESSLAMSVVTVQWQGTESSAKTKTA
jgi:hypothetical protein